MQQAPVTITTNTTTSLGNPVKARVGEMCKGTVYVYGTWNGATASLVISRDNGGTWIPVTDQSGSPIAFTANGCVNYEVAPVDDGIHPAIGITTASGGGSLSLTVNHDDTR